MWDGILLRQHTIMFRHPLTNFVTLALLVAVTAGCREKPKQEQSPAGSATLTQSPEQLPITAASRKEADDIFASRCVTCHGPTGEGNGAASAGLTPKPRNFHDADWQAGVTDEHVDKIIQYGGAAVGKSPAMPPNPDLVGKPEVVAALRQKIRSFKGK